MDNNTDEPDFWRPVQAKCIELGQKFNFWQRDKLEGFKGGALNFLLDRTSENIDIIAIIDADYIVERDWFQLTHFFQDPSLTVLQSPQDYRDHDSLFKKLCYYEYKSFFNTGMIIRDTFNALIMHGTMTLIRANKLKALRWSESCVCEDAELGLRFLKAGGKMRYLPLSFGKGLMPDTFIDYKKQRHRWVSGAMQILGTHWASLFGSQADLSWQQRYQFIVGWLHWLTQGGALILTVALITWTLLAAALKLTYPLIISASLLTASIMTWCSLLLFYVRFSPDGVHHAGLSILASRSLNLVVGQAVLSALVRRRMGFFVTPKSGNTRRRRVYPDGCNIELGLFCLLNLLSALILILEWNTPSAICWSLMLTLRSVDYGIAVFMGVVSHYQGSAPRSTRLNPEPGP